MLSVGFGVRLVAVGLARLREQDERRGLGGLEAGGEVQQDEGIHIELHPPNDIHHHPDKDDDRLENQKYRRAKKPRESLGLQRKPIVAKGRRKMHVRQMKTEVMLFMLRRWGRGARRV